MFLLTAAWRPRCGCHKDQAASPSTDVVSILCRAALPCWAQWFWGIITALESLPPQQEEVLSGSLTALVESGRPRFSSGAAAADGGEGWGKLDHRCLVGPSDLQKDQRPQAHQRPRLQGRPLTPKSTRRPDVSVHLCISLRHGQPRLAPWGLSSRLLHCLWTPVNPCEQAPDGGPCISSSLYAVDSQDTNRSSGSLRRCLHSSSWEGCVGEE